MAKQKRILLVEDEQSFRQVMLFKLREAGYQVEVAENGLQGYQQFTENLSDLVITDLAMPEMNGLELTRRIKAISPETAVIVITAYGDIPTAVAAIKMGAEDYLTKPLDWDEFKLSIERALKIKDLVCENKELRAFIGERFQLDNVIGTSKRMRELYDVVERVARTDVTVLLLGESGTGKELVAKGIHHNSVRRDRSFITINCGAIPGQLLESELFGHRKGAFTGAIYDKRGLFEEAHGGTVFLDEIGELPLNLQVKLLRVLQEGEFLRIGDNTARHVDVRVVAATNRNLAKMIEDGSFREDLYFRLNIVPIKLPPLRERKEDIPLLTNYFIEDAAKRYNRPKVQLTSEVYSYFHQYPWPGNVRELQNTIERLVVLARNEIISGDDLPQEIKQIRSSAGSIAIVLPEDGIDLEEIEKEIIRQALEKHMGNQTRTAKYLNITRNTLIYRMQKFNLT
ncbi:MAG: sigma-54 dependent transcriptional regulator [Acidobacteriota bacterium]